MAVKDLPLDQEKLVQRRIKEAILKSSILTGVPRCLQSLIPIFREFKEDGIDTFAPRSDRSYVLGLLQSVLIKFVGVGLKN